MDKNKTVSIVNINAMNVNAEGVVAGLELAIKMMEQMRIMNPLNGAVQNVCSTLIANARKSQLDIERV